MGKLQYLVGVVSLKLDSEACTGCGFCTKVCPHKVFAIEGKKAVIIARNNCMECGACALNCPEGAINVKAGVGCAAAVINSALGKKGACSCSLSEQQN